MSKKTLFKLNHSDKPVSGIRATALSTILVTTLVLLANCSQSTKTSGFEDPNAGNSNSPTTVSTIDPNTSIDPSANSSVSNSNNNTSNNLGWPFSLQNCQNEFFNSNITDIKGVLYDRNTNYIAANAQGRFTFCLSLNPSSQSATVTFEFMFQDIDGYYKTVTRQFEESSTYYYSYSTSSIEIIWRHSAGFVRLTGSDASATGNFTASVEYVNFPLDGEIPQTAVSDWDYINSCLDGSQSASSCVQNKLLHAIFFESSMQSSTDITERVLAIIRLYSSGAYPVAFSSLSIEHGDVGDVQFHSNEVGL